MNTSVLIAIVVIIIVIVGVIGYFVIANRPRPTSTTTSQLTTTTTQFSSVTTSSSSSSTTSSTSSTTSSSTSSTTTSTTTVTLPPGATQLPYNPNNKTVFIYLVATPTGSSLNYNGTAYGQMKIYIPAGWNVMVILTNDQPIPHNANIVLNDTPIPNNANISKDGKILLYVGDNPSDFTSNGVSSGQTAMGILDNISAGYYWIACGIYNHAEYGMWIDLIVSNSVSVPYSIISSSSSTTTTTTSAPPGWG